MNKASLTEADIRSKNIAPALLGSDGGKWDLHTQIREEVYFIKGRVMVRGRMVRRGEARKADYVLYHKPNLPLAVVEAKDNTHDECHRGSADEDASWRKILEYFASATQIGLTATPKETKDASNSGYFGDPVEIIKLFGDKPAYLGALRELEEAHYPEVA